jgi:hypothetical protein
LRWIGAVCELALRLPLSGVMAVPGHDPGIDPAIHAPKYAKDGPILTGRPAATKPFILVALSGAIFRLAEPVDGRVKPGP